jgi:nitrite reductase/ring-hydroxylating ferredoxin subunit
MADWQRVCSIKDLRDSEPREAKVGGESIAIVRVGDECFAVHDICTHAHAQMSTGFVEGHLIICPLHGASFDLRTGKCIDPPADQDIRCYAVKVEGGDVLIDATGIKA